MKFSLMFLLALVAMAGEGGDYMLRDSAHFETVRDEALACLHRESTQARLEAFYAALPQTASLGTLASQRAYLSFRKLLKYCKVKQYVSEPVEKIRRH
ncbi:MAG: hypothetical protein HY074_01815 [Deltaproteobacteria bacterium]|nr:hypothetical protein [Deltaproteobacteria bacterium]